MGPRAPFRVRGRHAEQEPRPAKLGAYCVRGPDKLLSLCGS